MKSYRKELWFDIPSRRGFVNITSQVEAALRDSGIKEGMALVNAMHISASVFINDDERGLHHDFEVWLEGLAPHAPVGQYQHNRTGEDNAGAHLKRQIMGREVVVAITDGKLDFGPWEQIFYGEFDGRRKKPGSERWLALVLSDTRGKRHCMRRSSHKLMAAPKARGPLGPCRLRRPAGRHFVVGMSPSVPLPSCPREKWGASVIPGEASVASETRDPARGLP